MATTYPHLCELVEEGAAGLRGLVKKRMFGCDAYFAGDAIFSVIWKTGRIGLKLPDPPTFAALMAIEGAEPWTAGTMQMSGWVLTPEAFHDDPEALTPWVRTAYAQNVGRKAAKRTAKATAKRTAKAAAKRTAKAPAKAAAKRTAKAAAKRTAKAAAKGVARAGRA